MPPCLVTAITCLKFACTKEEGLGAGANPGSEWRWGKLSPPVPLPLRLLCVGEPRRAARWKDRTDASKDHLDFKAALILAVLTPICLWPVVWELTSAILQYLTPYSQ